MSAEKHQKTTVNNVNDVMYAIFTMVQTAGQSAVQWADTAGASAVGNRGIFDGTNLIAASAVTSSTFANTSSYMVIESSAAMPSGRRWQVKISRGAANANLYTNFAPRGSWNYSTKVFDTANYPTTGNIDSFGGAIGNSRVLVSTSDLDAYGSSTPYAYLRVMLWESTVVNKGFYAGGYIPFDQTNNTNPAILLARTPSLGGAGVTWSYSTANGNCVSRISPEYTGATHDLSVAGYAHLTSLDTTYTHRDPNANWVNLPVYCRCIDDSSFFGYFGKYTMFAGDTSRSLCTGDSANEYLAVNDLTMRWKP